MQKIKTGQGNIPLISLIAIWSISLVVNLPGLAISPLLASLEKFSESRNIRSPIIDNIAKLFYHTFYFIIRKVISLQKQGIISIYRIIIIFDLWNNISFCTKHHHTDHTQLSSRHSMWNSNTFGSRAYNGHIHGCLQNKTTRNKIRNSQLVFSSCHSFSRLARKNRLASAFCCIYDSRHTSYSNAIPQT